MFIYDRWPDASRNAGATEASQRADEVGSGPVQPGLPSKLVAL